MNNQNDKRINIYFKLDEEGWYLLNINIINIRTVKNNNGATLLIKYFNDNDMGNELAELGLTYPTIQEANRIASYVYNSWDNGHEIANIYQMQQHYEAGKDY